MSCSRNLGVRPQNVPTAQQRQRKSPIPLFFYFLFFCLSVWPMPFNSCRVLQRGRSLALAPKKNVALLAERVSSPDVAPVLGRSGADVAASSAGQAPPAVAPVPSVGQAGIRAEEAPSGVTEQTTAEVTPPPMLERTELPLVLVAPSVVGIVPQSRGPGIASGGGCDRIKPREAGHSHGGCLSGRRNPCLRRPR